MMLTGVGFLADSYDVWVINIVADIMKLESYQEQQSDAMVSYVKSALLVGAILGQVSFGYLADRFGRKPMFVLTCLLVVIGSLGSALVVDHPDFGIYSQLCVCRFVLGFGIGGEYPLSATITSESSTTKHRGRDLATVFAMQGVGRVLCCFVLIGLLTALPGQHDLTWRLALGFGALPGMVAFYWRWTMEETVPYATLTAEEKQAPAGWWALSAHYKWLLLGTAGCWFLLDVTFYGNSLFSGDVTQAMGAADTPMEQSVANLWINLLAMPGYVMSIFFLDQVGRKRLQMLGFLVVAMLFGAMSMFHSKLAANVPLYVGMYALTFFFVDFGPNVTTFVLPVEIFPTTSRASCHGMSAAVGKAGAVVGVLMFKPLQNMGGIPAVFFTCAIVSLVGWAWTAWLIDDTVHSSLQGTQTAAASKPAEEVGINMQEYTPVE